MSGKPDGNTALESSCSCDGTSLQFGLYVSVFLESMVLYNSNRIPTELRRGIPLPSEEEVPQARLHQLALGVAFGSIVEGCMSTHGPPRQMLIEWLKPPATSGAVRGGLASPANASSTPPHSAAVGGYRITQTAGFVLNISPSPESNTGKQALVGLVLTVRQSKDAAALLQYPRWLRHFLNLAVDMASDVTMTFFEQHLKGVPAKAAVTTMHHSAAHATAFVGLHGAVAAVLRCASPSPALALRGTQTKDTNERGSDSTTECCAIPPLSGSLFSRSVELHNGMRCPRLVLPCLSSASFQRVAGAALADRCLSGNSTNNIGSPRAVQARRASNNGGMGGSGAGTGLDEKGTDVATLFRTAVSDLLTFNSSFTSAFVAGVLSISASLVLHPHDGTGYRQYWLQVEDGAKALREKKEAPGRGAESRHDEHQTARNAWGDSNERPAQGSSPPVTGRTLDAGSSCSGDDGGIQPGIRRSSAQAAASRCPTAQLPSAAASPPSAAMASVDARASRGGGGGQEEDEDLLSDLHLHQGVAQSYVEGGPVTRASLSVDAPPLVRDETLACSAPLNAKSLAAAAAAAERLAQTMPEHSTANPVAEQSHVPLLPSARVVIFSSDAELARKTMLLASFFLRIPEVDGAEQEAELLRLSARLVDAARDSPPSPSQDPLFLSSFRPVAAPCYDLCAPALPISWVPEEFNPKTHIDALVHQTCAPENLILIVSPRTMLVRRLHLRKRFSTQGLQMERRLHGITKTWPFGGGSGGAGCCFSSLVTGDVLLHHNQFVTKALQRSLAVEVRTKGVVHPAMYLEEVLSILGAQADLYRALVAHSMHGGGGAQSSILDVAEALLHGDIAGLQRAAQLSVGWPTNAGRSIASSSNVEVVSQSSRSHADGKSGSPIGAKPPFGVPCDSVKQFNSDLQQALGNDDVDVSHVQLLTFLAGDDLCRRR